MSYTFRGRTLNKIGVIGSGQIGPDIALHFAKVMAPHGTPVVVVDINDEALAAGKARLEKKVARGVQGGAFKPEEGEAITGGVEFTSDYAALAGADLVVEAATENEAIKGKIFSQLAELCAPDALLLSNSSHLEPEVIFAPLAKKSNTGVVHYFFPAERNRALEIVPGEATDPEHVEWLLAFYTEIGKVPIRVGSRYGYAIDPLFEGLLQTAALLQEHGVATSKQIDSVAQEVLGLGVGPFTAHNLTGGNPITAHGLSLLTTRVNPWFKPPQSLLDKVAKGEDWETPGRGEAVEVDADTKTKVADALRATFWGLSCEVLDSGITNVGDLDMAVEIGLVINPPFASMNAYGVAESLALVEALRASHPAFATFPLAKCLQAQAKRGEPWEIPYVLREDHDGVAVLTIRRPKVLNALNGDVFAQLQAHAEAIDADPAIQGAVITGFGTKAFVSGADVGFLAKIETPEQGVACSLSSQAPLNRIEAMQKPVVCAMNGLAFGGGNELAMSCHARVCKAGLRTFVGQPEPNLGIIPGAGGTQRLPRLIGIEPAAKILRDGRPISSKQALELGLVRAEVEGDVVAAAVQLVRDAAAGKVELPPIAQGPLADVPDALPPVELGHLSTAIDAIIQRAILEGARMSLADGLKHEAELFADVVRTQDMKIGITNFMTKGPRSKAEFVHA
ncbi:MAG: 3-hydroxyacyl-CoA dehydrogenase/enoyl-CoA hydratase family protein [Planctomycetes bacterium]|nr:3-hydroxyacyl-CoA dehydrogenase/enoyl-CoA hydratase family protein [Planctomycetota bacterium]